MNLYTIDMMTIAEYAEIFPTMSIDTFSHHMHSISHDLDLDAVEISNLRIIFNSYMHYLNNIYSSGIPDQLQVLTQTAQRGGDVSPIALEFLRQYSLDEIHAGIRYNAPFYFAPAPGTYAVPGVNRDAAFAVLLLLSLARCMTIYASRLDLNLSTLRHALNIHEHDTDGPQATMRLLNAMRRILPMTYENVSVLLIVISDTTRSLFAMPLRRARDQLNIPDQWLQLRNYLHSLHRYIYETLDSIRTYVNEPLQRHSIAEGIPYNAQHHAGIRVNSQDFLLWGVTTLVTASLAFNNPERVTDILRSVLPSLVDYLAANPSSELFRMGVSFATDTFDVHDLMFPNYTSINLTYEFFYNEVVSIIQVFFAYTTLYPNNLNRLRHPALYRHVDLGMAQNLMQRSRAITIARNQRLRYISNMMPRPSYMTINTLRTSMWDPFLNIFTTVWRHNVNQVMTVQQVGRRAITAWLRTDSNRWLFLGTLEVVGATTLPVEEMLELATANPELVNNALQVLTEIPATGFTQHFNHLLDVAPANDLGTMDQLLQDIAPTQEATPELVEVNRQRPTNPW